MKRVGYLWHFQNSRGGWFRDFANVKSPEDDPDFRMGGDAVSGHHRSECPEGCPMRKEDPWISKPSGHGELYASSLDSWSRWHFRTINGVLYRFATVEWGPTWTHLVAKRILPDGSETIVHDIPVPRRHC